MSNTIAAAVLAAILLAASSPVSAKSQDPVNTASSAQVAPPLVIGSGDLLSVTMFDSPELSGRFRVDQKGDVEMPLVTPIHVAGHTASEAAKLIETHYVQAQIMLPESSRSTVFIEEYANQGIAVNGEVKSPGIYPAFGVRMLNDVITAAGGLTSGAAARVVIRRRNDIEHPVTVPYNPEAHSPGAPQVQIFPGDSIVVPRAGIVYVLGNVNKAGGFVLDGHDTLTVEKAMALAGGSGRAAAVNRAQLVRSLPGNRKEMIIVPVDRILAGKAPDVTLLDGDILYVPTSKGRMATLQAINSALGIGTQVTIYKTAIQ